MTIDEFKEKMLEIQKECHIDGIKFGFFVSLADEEGHILFLSGGREICIPCLHAAIDAKIQMEGLEHLGELN